MVMPVLSKAKEMIAHITDRIAKIEANEGSCAACAERRAKVIAAYRATLDKLRGK